MIEPNIYCKISGMVMECISRFYKENNRKPIVLEIGCANGQGTERFAGFCERVICVDPMLEGRPDIDSRLHFDLHVDKLKVEEFTRRNKDFPINLIIGCSLWTNVIDLVKKDLAESKIDILVVDGCHHPFEAVWGDFEAYYPFVSNGGYVIFDDIYEDCIFEAYKRAKDEKSMTEIERWKSNEAGVLQECVALKKVEN